MATLLDRVKKAQEDQAWREEQQRITASPEEAKRQLMLIGRWKGRSERWRRSVDSRVVVNKRARNLV